MRYIPVHTGQICVVLSLSERAKVHPRVYGADSPTTVHPVPSMGSSPCIRGRYIYYFYMCVNSGFIPVHTGQINVVPILACQDRFIPVHTGQILNFPKISEAIKSLIPSQIPAVGSVCITFSEYVFADNTFWSKKTDKNKICPSSAICSIWEFVSLHPKMR